MAATFPHRDFVSASLFSMHLATSSMIMRPFAKAASLWSVGRAKVLGSRRGLAVVAVVVSDELATAIGFEFDQSRQRLVLRRDEIARLELRVVAEVLGHHAVHRARRKCYGSQEVGADDLNPLRDLGLARLAAN